MKLWLLLLLIGGIIRVNAISETDLKRLAELERWDEVKETLNREDDSPESFRLRFRGAELALEAGEMVLAGELLQALSTSAAQKSLPPEIQTRVLTMLEYLARNSPDQVEITLESARKLDASSRQSPSAQLDRAAILLNRAVYWRDTGRPEWTELTKLLHEYLQQFRDSGDAAIAGRKVLLHSRVMNLAGDHNGAAELLTQFLRFYYPECLTVATYRRKLPEEAARLLTRLGNCYVEMAHRANTPEEKKRFFSQAAVYWINAAGGTPENTEEYQRLLQSLDGCRESLALLGYQLRLPAFLPAPEGSGRQTLLQMLENRRYRALLTAVGERRAQLAPEDPANAELLALALSAHCGLDDFPDAAKTAEELYGKPLSAETVTRLFREGVDQMNRNRNREALLFFRVIGESGQGEHPDYLRALRNAARIAADENQPEVAVANFDRMLTLLPPGEEYWQVQYNALLALYQLRDYSGVRERFRKFNLADTPVAANAGIRLVAARSAMLQGENVTAIAELTELLQIPDVPPQLHAAAVLLTANATAADGPTEQSCQLLAEYLKLEPDSAASLDAANVLLEWYLQQPELADYPLVGSFLCRRAGFGDGELECLRRAARQCRSRISPEAALNMFATLQENTALTPTSLLQITEVIEQEFQKDLPGPASQLLVSLLRGRLQKIEDPLVKELRFRCIGALTGAGMDPEAKELAEAALAETPPFRYEDTRLLYARALIGSGDWRRAREIYQEILGQGRPEVVPECNLGLAHSWQAEGNDLRAIATAWNIVPPDVSTVPPERRADTEAALQLIRDCARRCSSKEDLQDAETMLRQLQQIP